MKRIKKITALFMTALIIITSTIVSTGAITVEKDGKKYILHSRTPATGDVNVLVIRIGFADYPVDDERNPADSEEKLLSYFDGTEGSINAFYETSSYGKLRLNCDRVYSYTAQLDRDEYDADNFTASSSPDGLILETLSALENEIDFDRYDSNGDGYPDIVSFDFSGPTLDWGSTWYPHVVWDADLTFKDIGIDSYTMLKGNATTYIHEYGHILGANDYYSVYDGSTNTILTYDIMGYNLGDHNGFTKWSYGWLDEEDIVFIDKASGETTVGLAPIETPLGDGKKIAVVAVQTDRSNSFLDEFFLVEYDSGKGNSAAVFEKYHYRPGFRIFHVNAKGDYLDNDEKNTVDYINDNQFYGVNLIHNIKNELKDIDLWAQADQLYREGDSLTPDTFPNTGMQADDVYNGLFTGISFTDFVTGDHPSFKVSFSDEQPQTKPVCLTLHYDELKADAEMMISSDQPLLMKNISPENAREYQPYLIDQSGTKYMLNAEKEDGGYLFRLYYDSAYPVILPNTAYTLVIPEGFFTARYLMPVGEFREEVITSDFFRLTVIAVNDAMPLLEVRSNVFPVTDHTFGILSMQRNDPDAPITLTEYNLNGEVISGQTFKIPELRQTEKRLDGCFVYRLNDSSFALELNTGENTNFIKIDRSGKVLSDMFTVSNSLISEHTGPLSATDYVLYHSGLRKRYYPEDRYVAVNLTVDFESEPVLTEEDRGSSYYALDHGFYAYEQWYSRNYHLLVYNADDAQTADITLPGSFHGAVSKNGNIIVIRSVDDPITTDKTVYEETYTYNGELLSRRDITASAQHINEYGVFTNCYTAGDNGFYLESIESNYRDIVAYDKDWHYLGVLRFDRNTTLTFTQMCGITQKLQSIDVSGPKEVIARFNIGDPVIVPKSMLLGDANLDGGVDITDATTIQRYDVKMTELSDTALQPADVDKDGDVSILDATWIQRWELKMKAPEGIGKPIT